MKKHHLILLTTALFITLFYGENVGLNLGILGIAYSLLLLFKTPERNRTRVFLILFVTSILSSIAFAWYGDFPSFLAILSSIFLLVFKSKNRDLKSIFVIPVFAINFFTFFCRIFKFDDWLPKKNTSRNWQKFISVIVIPTFFILIFFGIYTSGSEHFANLFTNYEFDFNFWELFWLTLLGFFIAFNIWNLKIERIIFKQNLFLKNDFLNEDKIQKPTFTFLEINAERTSGIVSLLSLNILLVIFIITFNYEQFLEVPKTINQLSVETHERVNAVILSIIMAILVILFYFKGNFNFDEKAKALQILSKIWIFLNGILVLSAMVKNIEYNIVLGLTYKTLGVYAFLALSLIGLIITFLKIQKQKTNAFLFNHMIWYFYGMILVCSFINWGGIITLNNSKRTDFAINFHRGAINFSEKQLLNYANEKKDLKLKNEILSQIKAKQTESFLSKTLFYETLKSK
jgi:hypothetical protein